MVLILIYLNELVFMKDTSIFNQKISVLFKQMKCSFKLVIAKIVDLWVLHLKKKLKRELSNLSNKRKIILFFKITIAMYCYLPINYCLLEGDLEVSDDSGTEDSKNNEDNTMLYIIGAMIIAGVAVTLFFNHHGEDGFSFFMKPDPFDMSIEYPYPNDGQCRPPENPTFVPMYDYFCIPGKPYFVDGIRNWPLLNRDLMTFIFTATFCPYKQDIPWWIIRGLEMIWGYDIHQEIFMNLHYHRISFPLDYSAETVFDWVKWYYYKNTPRQNYTFFHANEVEKLMTMDWYDVRIWPKIYTRKYNLPLLYPPIV